MTGAPATARTPAAALTAVNEDPDYPVLRTTEVSSPARHRAALVVPTVLLACWLGWIGGTFARLAQPREGRPEAADAVLQQLRQGPLSAPRTAPLAVRLEAPGCACAGDDDPRWQRIAAAMRARGGDAIRVQAALANPAGFALLLLGPEGQLRYAGPLRPPGAVCGREDGDLSAWLPALLDTPRAPLVLPDDCAC